MLSKALIFALAASPLVAAHGKVAVVTGDQGGNGTAIGIKGAVVAGAGSNSKTELDTTVFSSTKIATDGLGKTTGTGNNKVAMVSNAMSLSGSTLPQISATNGTLSGTFHVVTSDGAGPLQAMLDSTGTGTFSKGTKLNVVTQVPGNNGNIKKSSKRWIVRQLENMGIVKRATNINEDFPMAFSVPAGTTCTGTVAGQSNVCLIKIANSNPAGPFGGVVAVQIAGSGASNTTARSVKTAKEFSA